MFVLDRCGRPLDPCHPARARKLLTVGRAVIHRRVPLVIRLRDRARENSAVQGAVVRIDPGSKTTGIAVTTPGPVVRGLYTIELQHRGARIRDRMSQRGAYRRRRRSANQRYRRARFANRTRRDGWLPPSLRHRVDTTTSQTSRLARWAPVTEMHVEQTRFDTHALAAGRLLEGSEYQHGPLYGTEARAYLLATRGRRCAYCDAEGVPLNIDHLHPRSRGGSQRISNLALACPACNQAKGNRPVEHFLARHPARLAVIRRQMNTPLPDAAAVNATRLQLTRRLATLGVPVRSWSGGRTKWNRQRNRLPKSHTLDAVCVGEVTTVVRYPATVLVAEATGRGGYARTRTDKQGFPRLQLPRRKRVEGIATGDLVRADVPSGKKAGAHVGRVAVRSSGSFNIRTANGLVQGIHYRHVWLMQRGDGYGYTTRQETQVDTTVSVPDDPDR